MDVNVSSSNLKIRIEIDVPVPGVLPGFWSPPRLPL